MQTQPNQDNSQTCTLVVKVYEGQFIPVSMQTQINQDNSQARTLTAKVYEGQTVYASVCADSILPG